MLARETEHKRCEICFPRRALARAEGRRRGRSPLFAAGSMPGSSIVLWDLTLGLRVILVASRDQSDDVFGCW